MKKLLFYKFHGEYREQIVRTKYDLLMYLEVFTKNPGSYELIEIRDLLLEENKELLK